MVVFAFLAAGAGGLRVPPLPLAAASQDPALLALVRDGRTASRLVSLDPRTLERLPGPSLRLTGITGAGPLSPNGRLVALSGKPPHGVRIVQLAPTKVVRRVPWRSQSRMLSLLAWPNARRIVGLDFVNPQGPSVPAIQHVDLVDPVARKIKRRSLGGWAFGRARAGDDLVFLLDRAGGIRPARLAVLARDGRLRVVVLDRILAGSGDEEWIDQVPAFHVERPGLAVDPKGRRAFVVTAGSLVAEVDLTTLAVSYHDVSARVSALARLRNWLVPAAEAKSLTGWSREATWLGNDTIAVTGSDYAGSDSTAVGLRFIDTRSWTVQTIEADASGLRFANGLLLAFGGTYTDEPGDDRSLGLAAYTPDGTKVWHALPGEQVGWPQIAGGHAYLYPRRAEESVRAIALSTGTVRTLDVREMPTFVVADSDL